ncbi:MAG: beta-lactamase family protein [Candidatus Nealsonbacteria bacterium]|nr:beta-lactamase family protein [Candidatus Nealsonbacteria bacterium]
MIATHHLASPVAAIFLLLSATIVHRAPAAETPAPPPTGVGVPGMASFDRIIPELMRKHVIHGGAVAVAKDGRLVLARGYGLADVHAKQPVQPDSLFRIASVSKPITAAAILVLVQRKQLDIDAKVLDILDDIKPPQAAQLDPRWRKITVRHLLHHAAGFDRGKSFDPMLRPAPVVEAVGTTPEPAAIVRFMLGRPLDFDPCTRHAYSNFGYSLLGRIIEQTTGKPYAEAVETLVLRPAGIRRMRLGRTQRKDLADGEVHYYPTAGAEPVDSIFPDVSEQVPAPYGKFYIEAMDAHGGWIASAVDLVRFATATDGSREPALLKPATIGVLQSRPSYVAADEQAWYALGWMVRPKGDSANWWHAGSLPGTRSLLVRTHHGLVWAVVLNTTPRHSGTFGGELDRTLWRAVEGVEKWPAHDLFGRYR